MRFPVSFVATFPLILGVIFSSGAASSARAADTHAIVIAASDGYGVEDCLAEAGECGQVVADAWCESHGHGAAVSFGRAEDVVGPSRLSGVDAPYVINCRD